MKRSHVWLLSFPLAVGITSLFIGMPRAEAASPPPTPANVTATATSSSTTHVTWGSVSGASFVVSNGDTSVSVAAGTTTYDWGGQSPGNYMCFTVAAKNGAGQSPWSPYSCATTPVPTPANVTATATSSSTTHVTWGNVSGASFVVSNGDTSVSVAAGTTTYDWGGQSPGNYMCFTVAAKEGIGQSPWSAYSCTTTPVSSAVDVGSNDYPWSPLCTFSECGPGKVACNTNNGFCGDPWGMGYGQCVSFVAWKIYELYGGAQRPAAAQGTQNQNWRPSDPGVNGDPVNSSWGIAGNWPSAAGAGRVTQTPAVGDVAEWNVNSKGMGSSGHVMMVVAVSSGNSITVAGYNTHLDGSYGEWNIPWNDQNWSGSAPSAPPWPDNFIAVHP
jgi:CHAP domain